MRIHSDQPTMVFERKLLIFVTAALSGLGLLMVYSASITAKPSFADQTYLTRQLMFLAIGVTGGAIASRLPATFWRGAAIPIAILTTVLLIAVLIPGIGSRMNGAKRWFRYQSLSVQPSELAKLSLVLFMAWVLDRKRDGSRRSLTSWAALLALPVVLSGLILVEPDFGTSVFLLAVAAVMLFLGGMPVSYMLMIALVLIPACGLLVVTQPYRAKRVFEFLQGWSDPAAAPYQVRQSLVALGSGSIWGSGLGKGWQKLGFLPEANTDFVFAVLGEELGLIGTITVLILWATFLVCGIRLARAAKENRFAMLASLGLVVQSFLQAVLNIGVVTGSLPPKGISLPFLSAGGSNLVVSLIAVGVVLGLTRHAGDESLDSRPVIPGGTRVDRFDDDVAAVA